MTGRGHSVKKPSILEQLVCVKKDSGAAVRHLDETFIVAVLNVI